MGSWGVRKLDVVVFVELSFKTVGSGGTDRGFLGWKVVFLWNCRSKQSVPMEPSVGSWGVRKLDVVVFVELSFKTVGSGGTECGFLGWKVLFLWNCRSYRLTDLLHRLITGWTQISNTFQERSAMNSSP